MSGSGAPWRQIRDDMAGRITAGEWPVGSPIPSVTELTRIYSAGRSTVQRAVKALRESGVLRGEQGVNVTVVREPAPGDLSDTTIEDRVAALEERVERLERGER